jgi:alkylated DNA repair dioxygenase AlkB
MPEGFRYQRDMVRAEEERGIVAELEKLEFAPFDFHGFLGRRRVTSFGWRYDFGGGGLKQAEPLPAFLVKLRDKAAAVFGLRSRDLEQVLLTQYPPGATIGWHKDRSVFGDVIGISFLSPCSFRFRRKSGKGWERRSLILEPRSAYLLQSAARLEWEHSIPAVEALRYSVTFRSLK